MVLSCCLEIDLFGLTSELEKISFPEIDLGRYTVEKLDGSKHATYISRKHANDKNVVLDDDQICYWKGSYPDHFFCHLQTRFNFSSNNKVEILDWLKKLNTNRWCYRTYFVTDSPSSETFESYFGFEEILQKGIWGSDLLTRENFVNRCNTKLSYLFNF